MIRLLLYGFFCFFISINPGKIKGVIQSDIIDINQGTFSRINLSIRLTTQSSTETALERQVLELLKKNLLWSGVFRILEPEENYDLTLVLTNTGEHSFSARIYSDNDRLLYKTAMNIPTNPLDQEPVIIEFVRELIFQLTGDQGILGTTLVFSEKVGRNKKQLVITDTHEKKRKIILKNNDANILPRWGPDGKSILYTAVGNRGSWVFRYFFQTKRTQRLAAFRGISSGGSWGKKSDELILTISHRGNFDLYRINDQGKILQRMTRRSSIETAASWSPDGKAVLFISNRSRGIHIYQMSLPKKEIFRMTFQGSYNTDPQWSKDGQFIVFAGQIEKKFQIFVMDKYGEQVRQLTFGEVSSEQPAWSPDGRQIVYVSHVRGDEKLFIMTTDGLFKRRLTNSGFGIQESNPSWSGNFEWNLLNKEQNEEKKN